MPNYILQAMAMAEKSPERVFARYIEELVKCLPMDDTLFITKLHSYELLPGDICEKLNSLPTQADQALFFLNHVIKPALDIDESSSFHNLLSVMEQCGYTHVEKLSYNIKSQMEGSDIGPGMHVEFRNNVITVVCLNTVFSYIQ